MNDKKLKGKKLAENIKKLMKTKGLNQNQLAKLTGLHRGHISEILNSKYGHINWYTLFKIAEALDTTMDSIALGSEIEIIDNPDYRKIIAAMPEGAKIFFKSTKRLPQSDVKAVIDVINIIIEKNKLKEK